MAYAGTTTTDARTKATYRRGELLEAEMTWIENKQRPAPHPRDGNAIGDQEALPDEHPQFRRVISEGRRRLHEPASPVKDAPMSFALALPPAGTP